MGLEAALRLDVGVRNSYLAQDRQVPFLQWGASMDKDVSGAPFFEQPGVSAGYALRYAVTNWLASNDLLEHRLSHELRQKPSCSRR